MESYHFHVMGDLWQKFRLDSFFFSKDQDRVIKSHEKHKKLNEDRTKSTLFSCESFSF